MKKKILRGFQLQNLKQKEKIVSLVLPNVGTGVREV